MAASTVVGRREPPRSVDAPASSRGRIAIVIFILLIIAAVAIYFAR